MIRILATAVFTTFAAPASAGLVAARDLQAGILLAAADVRDHPGQHGSPDDPAELIGLRLLRAVAAGTPLRLSLVSAPLLVRRGDRVAVVADGGGFRIEASAEALEAGGRDAVIRLRSLSSGRLVTGRIVAPGLVTTLKSSASWP